MERAKNLGNKTEQASKRTMDMYQNVKDKSDKAIEGSKAVNKIDELSNTIMAVSYTHLDVYKRQVLHGINIGMSVKVQLMYFLNQRKGGQIILVCHHGEALFFKASGI